MPVFGQDLLGKQLQTPQAADFGHQHEEVQATGRVLGNDVLDLVDGTVVDGLLGQQQRASNACIPPRIGARSPHPQRGMRPPNPKQSRPLLPAKARFQPRCRLTGVEPGLRPSAGAAAVTWTAAGHRPPMPSQPTLVG